MKRLRTSRPSDARTFIPLLVMTGPLLCAVALTALGYLMFRMQAGGTPGLIDPLEYTVILALAGALVSLVLGVLGLMAYNRSRAGIEARERAFSEGAERLVAVDEIARRIAYRGERREAVAVAWTRRQREMLAAMNGLAGPRAALQRVASDIWAGVSQPGAPLDAPTALRMARESAVAAAALGAALDDLRVVMSAPAAEVDEIAAIDDALVADLIALDELAARTRHEIEAATGHMPAVRVPSDSRWRDIPYLNERAPLEADPWLATRPPERAPGASAFGAAPPPVSPASGKWPAAQDSGRQQPPAPGSSSGRLRGGAPGWNPGDSSAQWPLTPRPPQDAGGQRGASPPPPWQPPRDRDDSSSRWLND